MNASRSIWLGLLAPRAFYKRRRNRIAFVVALLSLLCCSAAQGYAAENLACPEIGPGRVPDLIGDATGGGLFATENRIKLANEINDATNRLQISDPQYLVERCAERADCRVLSCHIWQGGAHDC